MMGARSAVSFASCAICLAAAFAQDGGDGTVRHVTQTGMRVIVRPESSSGLVAIAAAVDTSGAEALTSAWTRRVAARALFGGNRNLSAEGVAREIHRAGGSLTVEALPDCIMVRCVTTPSAFNDAAYVILQALKGAVFDADMLRRASASVAAELAEESESPVAVGAAAARSRLFGAHRYGSRLTSPDARERSGLAVAVQRFYRAAFVPGNTVVAIVGELDARQAIRTMENHAVDFDRRPDPRASRLAAVPPPESAEAAPSRMDLRAETRSGAAVVGMQAVGRRDPDAAAMAVLAAVIGGGKGSRMFRSIRDGRGVGYIVGSEAHLWRDGGWLSAYVEHDARRSAPDDVSIARMVEDVLADIQARPPDEPELERARAFVVGAVRRSRERGIDMAQALAEAELLDADWRRVDTFIHEVQAVTAQDVVRAASRIVDSRVVVTVRGSAMR